MAQAQSQKLTAEALLSAPSRGPAVPNYNGKLALYTVATHTFGGKTAKEFRVMDLEKQTSVQILDEEKVHDVLWIPGTSDVACLKSGDKGKTELLVAHGDDGTRASRTVATFDAPVQGMRLQRLGGGGIAMVAAGLVKDGSLFNDDAAEPASTARVFDNGNIRTGDELYKSQRYTLWYNMLEHQGEGWKLAGPLINLINDATLESTPDIYGGSAVENFDVSENGVAFVARDLTKLKPEELRFCKPYFVAVGSFTQAPAQGPQAISLPSDVGTGVTDNVRFSPDGSDIAFIYRDATFCNGNRIYAAPVSSLKAHDMVHRIGSAFDDDSFNPPTAFEFAGCSDTILFRSDKRGRNVLSSLKLQDGQTPRVLVGVGSVSGFHPLADGNWDELFVSSSSFVEKSTWQVVRASDGTVTKTFSSATSKDTSSTTGKDTWLGLSRDMVTDYDFEGADGYPVHAFLVRPSDFDKSKKYPWVVMVHGGPVAAWTDQCLASWNPAAWAQQGYVVVMPNITGSTGYGLEHARRIRNDWGGRPYRDLISLRTSLESLPYLDQSKAIIAGGSYGGFMISWMMGHDIINQFCGAVWQSGIYNLSTFTLHIDGFLEDVSFNGATYPWQDPAAFDKFNPAKSELVRNWGNAPPTLIIHPEKDYRCCITEGYAAYRTLQAHGVPSRFLTFSDEGHGIQKPENVKVFLETTWDWINKCVDGEVKRNTKA